ncbi:MAG: hypothetical protein ABJG15_08380 [Hyphomonadaceae bacterium]
MKLWLIGTVAAAALLTGCGKKDDAASAGDAAALEIGSVELPAVQLRAGDAAQAEAALGALSLTESGSGRINFADRTVTGADAVFSDISVVIGDGQDDEEGTISAQSLTLKGLDMSDGEASFAQMRLDGIVVTPEDADEDGILTISDMQISNPSPALAAWVASLMGDGEPAEFPDFADLSFDAISMNNFSAVPADDNELQAFDIDRIDFRNMSEEGLGAMIFEGLNFSATDENDGTAANFSLGSLNVLGVTELLTKTIGAGLGDDLDNPGSVLELLSSNPADPGYDAIQLENLSVDVSGIAVDLPAYSAEITRDQQGRAIRNQTHPFKATLNVDPNGEMGSDIAGPLGLLGYETLTIGGAADSRINHDDDIVSADAASNYLELEDGFRLSLGGEFAGLSDFYAALADAGNGDSDADVEAAFGSSLSQLGLHGMEITFADDSFVDRAFAAAAAMNGGTPEDLKNQAKLSLGLAPLMASSSGVDANIITELTAALGEFISNPGTLTVKLDPEAPITADMMENPSLLTKEAIGFSASSN